MRSNVGPADSKIKLEQRIYIGAREHSEKRRSSNDEATDGELNFNTVKNQVQLFHSQPNCEEDDASSAELTAILYKNLGLIEDRYEQPKQMLEGNSSLADKSVSSLDSSVADFSSAKYNDRENCQIDVRPVARISQS